MIDLGKETFINSTITTVIIPEGITQINAKCFMDCTMLSKVDLPEGLIRISVDAFNNTAIQSIIIPSTVKEIARNAFRLCSQLTNLSFKSDESIKIFGFAFSKTALSFAVIPLKTRYLSGFAFYECHLLELLLIPYNTDFDMEDKLPLNCEVIRYSSSEERSLILKQYNLD